VVRGQGRGRVQGGQPPLADPRAYGSFRHALRTEEANALEPDVLDNKYYVKGIGEVAEVSVKGPREALKLVEIIS
jgi:hypothetical protein